MATDPSPRLPSLSPRLSAHRRLLPAMAPLGVLPVAEGARHQLVAAHVWFLTNGHTDFWDSPTALPLSCGREPRCRAAVPRQPCTNGLKGRRRASGRATEEPGAQHPPSGASAQDPRVLPWSTGVSLLCSCLCITSTTCTTVPGAPLGPRRMKQQHPWPMAPPKSQPLAALLRLQVGRKAAGSCFPTSSVGRGDSTSAEHQKATGRASDGCAACGTGGFWREGAKRSGKEGKERSPSRVW